MHLTHPERDVVTAFNGHPGWNHLDGTQALAYVRARHLQVFVSGAWVPAPAAADERSGRASALLAQLGTRLHVGIAAPLESWIRIWELSGVLSVDGNTTPITLYSLGTAMSHSNAALPARTADHHP